MNIVLVFCEETRDGGFPAIISGICQFARTRKWHIENISPENHARSIKELLDFWKPVGCIVVHGVFGYLPRKAFGKVPVVFLNREPIPTDAGASVVEMDHVALVNAGVAELSRSNPRCIGFIPYLVPSRNWCKSRERAFAKCHQSHQMPQAVFVPRSKKFRIPRITFIRELRKWLRKLPKPCAILAANDEMASIVAVACSMEGLHIPKDVSLLGIDDNITICRNSNPELSSVRPNFMLGANIAAQLLDRAIRYPRRKGKHVIYPPSGVIRRESTRFLMRHDSEVADAVSFIKTMACTSITTEDIHRKFSCAKRTADERFRAATGQSMLEMIHDVRLARMKELLSDPAQELYAIANLCGYSSQNAACKFFRLKTGSTMTAWRNECIKRTAGGQSAGSGRVSTTSDRVIK